MAFPDPRYQQQPPPYPYWLPQPPSRGTNGLSIAALVLGIVWIYWIGSILAVIFGHVAIGQIKRTGASGYGMAVAGLVLGYIGVALLLLLIIGGFASGFADGAQSD